MTKRSWLFIVCAAPLLLSACTTSHKASLNEERDALVALQASLMLAQKALGSSTNAEQRAEAVKTIVKAREDLRKFQQDLVEQPESAAKTAAGTALTALDTALERVAEALGTDHRRHARDAGPGAGRPERRAAEADGGVGDGGPHRGDPAPASAGPGDPEHRSGLGHTAATERTCSRTGTAAAPPPPPEPTAAEKALSEALTGLTRGAGRDGQGEDGLRECPGGAGEGGNGTSRRPPRPGPGTRRTNGRPRTARRPGPREPAAQTVLATAETAFVTARAAERTAAADPDGGGRGGRGGPDGGRHGRTAAGGHGGGGDSAGERKPRCSPGPPPASRAAPGWRGLPLS